MNDPAEMTRLIKTTLRKQFLGHKFKVSHGGKSVEWSDANNAPTVIEVEDAIIAAGIVEVRPTWNNGRMLDLSNGDHMAFYRFNVAESEAFQRDLERRRIEREEMAARHEAATIAARKAKLKILNAARHASHDLDSSRLQAAFDAFENMRQRAEAAARGNLIEPLARYFEHLEDSNVRARRRARGGGGVVLAGVAVPAEISERRTRRRRALPSHPRSIGQDRNSGNCRG